MEEPIVTYVHVGKYRFKITDSKSYARGELILRSFNIGGDDKTCVNISISYYTHPIHATLSYANYDAQCSIDTPLDRGEGSVAMIQTLLNHVHETVPAITEVIYDDMSRIECASSSVRDPSNSKPNPPIPLYYFSIAFNEKTWYEKHFHARQRDVHRHEAYRKHVNRLLHSEELKTNTPFLAFISIAKVVPTYIYDELEGYYIQAATFGDFFRLMPASERCRLVRDWIETFMSYHLGGVFSNTGWVIDVPITITHLRKPAVKAGGGRRRSRYRSKRRTKKSKKCRVSCLRRLTMTNVQGSTAYYCPPGRILHQQPFMDLGVDPWNI